ncbi:glycosyltransferase family 39 protein [Spirosoma litoris]
MVSVEKTDVKPLLYRNTQEKYGKLYPVKETSLLLPSLVLLIGCLLVTTLIRYRLIFFVSSDIGGIESNAIYSIQRYMAGYPLYANPEIAPYSITQYSPIYYRIVAAIGYLAGVELDDTLGIYRLSRLVSLVANGFYAVLLFALGKRFSLTTKASMAIAISAFVLLPPQAYSRPDSLYILWVIATLYAVVRAIQTEQKKPEFSWLAGAVGLAALAIATKQSGIVLPFAVVGYYVFVNGHWLKGLVLGGCIGLTGLVFLIGFMPEHDPILLYANIINGVNQGVDWSSFKINIVDHYFRTFSVHIAIGLPLCIWLIRQTKADYRWLGWSVLVLFGFSLSTSIKWGSALNYFTEYVALTGLVVAVWLNEQSFLINKRGMGWPLLAFSAIFWAVVPNMTNFNWPLLMRSGALSETPYRQQKQIADYLRDSLKLKSTDAVFVTNYNYCYLNGLLYRNCIIPQQDMIAAVMYPRKKLDYSAFDKQISQQGIRFLITRSGETSTEFPGLTTAHYVLRRRFPEFDVYESR